MNKFNKQAVTRVPPNSAAKKNFFSREVKVGAIVFGAILAVALIDFVAERNYKHKNK